MQRVVQNIVVVLVIFGLAFPYPLFTHAQEAEEGVENQESEVIEGGGEESSLLSIADNKWLNSYSDRLRLPQVQQNSGAFTHDIPIVTPPGRNGMQPNLKLSYNSQNQDLENIFGLGWSINLPYIERINKKGIGKTYTQTYFTSSLDGELASTSATTYGAKFDDGGFREYVFSTSTSKWTMTDKRGMQYVFGSSTTARLYNNASSTQTFRWMLEEMRDTNGNYMRYEYTKDSEQVYPYKITYTGSATTSAPFEVLFVTEARDDDHVTYKYGFEVTTAHRIDEIQIKINSTLARKYAFAYTTGHNSVKSLLSSITETGYNEASTSVSLPAITFSYQGWETTWAESEPSPFNLPNLVDHAGRDLGFRFFNYNRNANTDAILFKVASSTEGYEHNGTGWNSVAPSDGPDLVDSSGNDRGAALADVDGDLFPDIILGKESSYTEVYLWQTSQYAASTTMTNTPALIDADGNDLGIRFGDFNGDGYADYMRGKSGLTFYTYLNKADGTGWENPVDANLTDYFVDTDGNDYGVRVADLNGDGLDDVIRFRDGDTSAVINLNKGDGTSWEDHVVSGSDTYAPPQITGADGADIGTRLTDLNADGLMDFIVTAGDRDDNFYINRGNGISWTKFTAPVTLPLFVSAVGQDFYGTRIMQANTDGIPDFVRSSPSGKKNYLSTGKQVDRLTQIDFPEGGVTTVTYNGTAVESVLFHTVNTITKNPDDGGASITETFTFGDGGFQTLYQNRKFYGFGVVTKVDSSNHRTITYYHQGNGVNTVSGNVANSAGLGELDDVEAKMYRPYRIEKRTTGNSNFHAFEINRWDKKDLGNGRSLVYLKDDLKFEFNNDSTHKDSAITYDYATSTGNLIQKIEWGEVVATTTGTFTDSSSSDNRTTTWTYATSSGTGVTGLPSVETKVNNAGTKVFETRNYYDGLGLGTASKGNLTAQDFWKFGTSYNSIQNTYNSYGLVATSTDARGKSTAYKYDSYFLYPATTTLPLSQTIQNYYDYSSGKPKITIDRNGYVYQTDFDGFDRPTLEKQPDSTTPSTLVTKTAYAYTDTHGAVKVQRSDYLASTSPVVTTHTYFDGLSRKIQERVSSESTYAVKDFVYDSRGLLQKESLPYFSVDSVKTTATSDTDLYTTYTYDALERQTNISNVVGSTTIAYDDWKTTSTDPLSKQKSYYKDGFSNLVQVDEIDGGSTYTTEYQWDSNNNLTKVTDALDNVRNFTYNGVSWLVDAEDLHAAADVTFGTWHYAYHADGQKNTITDPKGQVTTFAYDDQGRVTSEDYSGTASVDVSYLYDTCTNGVGLLCTVKTLAQSTNSTTTYAYDPLGRVDEEEKTINTSVFTTGYDYDFQGNITLLTYPDDAQVQYTYNNGGLVETVSRKESGGSFTTLISDFDYAPTGQPSYIAYANGMVTERTYDENELYRLKRILTEFLGGVGGMGDEGPLSASELEFLLEDVVIEEATSTPEESLELSSEATTTPELITEEATTTAPTVESATTTEETTTTTATSSPEVAAQEETVPEIEEQASTSTVIRGKEITRGDTRITIATDPETTAPGARFDKWDEVSLTLSIPAVGELEKIEDAERVVWSDTNKQVRFYELPANEILPEGGFEVDVVFDQKPSSNVVAFDLKVENLDFFYQAPLDQEPKEEGVTRCTATQCFDSAENAVMERPEHVVGSYAVYHKEGVTGDYSRVGGKNYATGKAFHIYRPKISDATGTTTWGELNINPQEGKLTVTVPQAFLDTATYPIVVDPTFGWGAPGGSTATTTNAVGSKFSIAEHGSITSISQYTKANSGTIDVGAAVYSDVSGAPNALLTYQTATTSVGTTVGWATTTVSTYPTASSTTLWLWSLGSASRAVYWDSGTSNQYNLKAVTWPTWPTTITPGTYFARKLSIYATYTPVSVTILQDMSYTYDAAGNITQITDNSTTGAGKVLLFGYDNLHRLTSASTTAASSSPMLETYAYNELGNITSKSGIGSYTYTGTNYANPHAATSIGGTTFTYDENGNQLTRGAHAFTWDYRNQLKQSVVNNATTTYAYDANGSRIKLTVGSNTTYYPNDYFEKLGATSTSRIYAGGSHIATVEKPNGTTTPTLYFVHPDHLGSTNVLSGEGGDLKATYDYTPYGTMRINDPVGSYTELHRFAGTEYGAEDQLNYMEARYQDRSRGRFISQDPVFIAGGDGQTIEELTGLSLDEYLTNPQGLNSYSYAQNDPVNLKDPNGTYLETAVDLAFIATDVAAIRQAEVAGLPTGHLYLALIGDIIGAVTPGLTGVGLGIKAVSNAGDATKGAQNPAIRDAINFGKEQHKQYNPGEGYILNKVIPGTRLRPDALNPTEKIIRELKPNNPAAIQKGQNQLQKYIESANKAYGGSFRGILDLYKK